MTGEGEVRQVQIGEHDTIQRAGSRTVPIDTDPVQTAVCREFVSVIALTTIEIVPAIIWLNDCKRIVTRSPIDIAG